MKTEQPSTEADNRPTEWSRLNEYVGEYLRDSEVIGEDENGMEGEFTLTERDEYMREDAVQGLLGDERFLDMVVAARMLTLRSRSAEGGCPTCGARNGEHFGTRCADPLHAEVRAVLCPSAEPAAEPSPGLLISMAIRSDHGLGVPGYYDGPLFAHTGITHQQRLESAMRSMRQLWEEATGRGFWSPENECEYLARLPPTKRDGA